MRLSVDEFGKKIAAYSGRADQNQREMIAMFLEALVNDYVGGKGYANSTERPVKNVILPNLNIFGSSQIKEITGALSSAAAADGLIQRFLFVPTFAEYRTMKDDYEKPEVPPMLIESIRWIVDHLSLLGGDFAMNDDPTSEPNQCIVQLTTSAKVLLKTLDQRRVDMACAGRVMWVRSAAMAMKIAMLEAIARDPVEPVIDAELLDSASRPVDWFTLYAETFVRNRIADSYQETKLNKVKQLITAAGSAGITRSDLLRKTQSIGKKDPDELLDRLIESEERLAGEHWTPPTRLPRGSGGCTC